MRGYCAQQGFEAIRWVFWMLLRVQGDVIESVVFAKMGMKRKVRCCVVLLYMG